jgi:dTDP-4-amino-4,6-dideoxygalactose transaminase
MLNTSFSPWPSYTEEEADAVRQVLASNKTNYRIGGVGRLFEREFASFCGTDHAVALANGTVALDLALRAVGIGPGDEVVVTPRTFFASVSSVVNAGAIPVFADVDLDSQNITPVSVQAVLTPRTRAIICVHLAGWPCDMDGMLALARDFDLAVIEDCAQAHGARYRDQAVGSLGDVGAWSFCQDKIITTGGEGGMVTTSDPDRWRRMWAYKDHGKDYEAVHNHVFPPGFRWEHEFFGTNGRLTEMQSAIGRVQLRRIPEWHARRLQIANTIWLTAMELPGLRVPRLPPHIEHAAYKCYVFVSPEELAPGWDRDRVMAEINALGVPCYSGSCPEVYLEKAFESTGYQPPKRLPNAKELGETSLMFLCHPTLTNDEVAKTCDVLETVMQRAVTRQKFRGTNLITEPCSCPWRTVKPLEVSLRLPCNLW